MNYRKAAFSGAGGFFLRQPFTGLVLMKASHSFCCESRWGRERGGGNSRWGSGPDGMPLGRNGERWTFPRV